MRAVLVAHFVAFAATTASAQQTLTPNTKSSPSTRWRPASSAGCGTSIRPSPTPGWS